MRPSVANVQGADTFLIGCHRNLTGPFPTIADQRWLLRTVSVAGTISNRVTVPYDTSTGTPSEIVVGGDSFDPVLQVAPTGIVVVRCGGSGSNNVAPCGSCTIVPSPDILFPAANPFTLAIPCDPLLVGQNLFTQWLLLKPSTCPILPDLAFTNALRFTIGE